MGEVDFRYGQSCLLNDRAQEGVRAMADSSPTWSFLTSHACVLLIIAADPSARIRDIADSSGITERHVQKIVSDLEPSGYLRRERVGRRSPYLLAAGASLRNGPAQAELAAVAQLALLTEPRVPGSAADHRRPAASHSRRDVPGQHLSRRERIAAVTVSANDIEKAAAVLRSGGLVALPTETVYGLGANAEDPAAVGRIFQAKGRPPSHPLIVHIGLAELLGEWVEQVPEPARLLAQQFWPGPLTLVLRRGTRVPLEATGGLETVAVRVPDHPVALDLLAAFGGGIAAPSANRFGSVSPTTAEHVRAELADAVDFVLDGGPCRVGVESTIVDVTGPAPSVLRPGGIAAEDLAVALGSPITLDSSGRVRAPGQHPSHYAPTARVLLAEPSRVAVEAQLATEDGHRVGVLLPPDFADLPMKADVVVRVPASAAEYAHRLYALLREFDQQRCDVVIASLPPQQGLGLAIANRLRRAAGPRSSA
jgi:L-threonylcarbamoyladenylate synthase